MEKFCLIDVGSTTTKAFLFLKDGDWTYFRSESPTTVEKPFEDVTRGVLLSLEKLQEVSGEKLIEDSAPCVRCFSTSSAGGGLAMIVAGLVRGVTAQSAERAALGAGALILDCVALDDGRTNYKKIEAMQKLRPDMLLLAGGFDGGAVFGSVFMAELINQSELRPKLTGSAKLPVIFAGNKDARYYVEETLRDKFDFFSAPNIRPESKRENLEPTRAFIHDLFMDHVMSHAPGYDKYKSWISGSLLPTPGAVARLLSIMSKNGGDKIMAIDIGGATTDVFSAENGEVFRTVSANLGMSYSILNVARMAGLAGIRELLDFQIDEKELLNRLANKYLHPTSLPDNIEDSRIECAAATMAVREAVKEHFRVKMGLSYSRSEEDLTYSALSRKKEKEKKLDIGALSSGFDLIIGSGGILSHSPRETAAMILINALTPSGEVDLAVDSMFIFPHLGVLSEVDPDLSMGLLRKFGMVRLGTLVAPAGTARPGSTVIEIEGGAGFQRTVAHKIRFGEFRIIPFQKNEKGVLKIKTRKLKKAAKRMTIDPDPGLSTHVPALIIDARGRPASDLRTSYLPDDYAPPVHDIAVDAEKRIHSGSITIDRKLSVPGEVLVKKGDRVSITTIIARSIKAFLRPFFLNITESLKVPPEKLPDYFRKNIGDEVARDEILAERRRGILEPYIFRSPVSGKIEKILPSGTVVVREKPEFTGKLSSVKVAKDLDIKPQNIEPYLKCRVGQEVEMGQHLAELGLPPKKVSVSPMRGRVKSTNLEHGVVIIESLLEELEITAWLPGIVDEVDEKGCAVSGNGTMINGRWGRGGETFGKLILDGCRSGHVSLVDYADADFLTEVQRRGGRGIIAGSADLMDVEELNPEYTIVLTEGFGKMNMSIDIMNILKSHESKTILLDGTTQLRVGVKRPLIILPDNS